MDNFCKPKYDLLKEILESDHTTIPAVNWLKSHNICDDENHSYEIQMAIDVAEKAYTIGLKEASSNSSYWYVLDHNGNELHIGDLCDDIDCDDVFEITLLGEGKVGSDTIAIPSNECSLVVPDSRDRIVKELFCELKGIPDLSDDEVETLLAIYVDRAIRFGEENQ